MPIEGLYREDAPGALRLSDYQQEQLRNFVLDQIATQGSPAEAIAQLAFPDYKSSTPWDPETIAMGYSGGMKVKGPRGPAGFLTPEGVHMTGQYHDINALPEPWSRGENLEQLKGGFADEYGPFVTKKQIDQYLANPSEGYWPKTPTNEPAASVDFSGPEVIGRVGPEGGMAFRGGEHGEGRYFSRAPDEPMPTSGLPDEPAAAVPPEKNIAPEFTQRENAYLNLIRGKSPEEAMRAYFPKMGVNQPSFPPAQVLDIQELYRMFGKEYPKWTPED